MRNKHMNPWEILGIENAADKRTIKKAYTRLLKQIDVDANPAAFQELREAYELALALCEGNFIFDERFFSDEPTQVEIEPGERDFSPPEPRATDRSEFGESDIEIEPENRDSRPFPNEPEITPGPAYQAHLRVENLMQTLRVSGDMDAIRELKQITKEEIYESLDFKQHLEEELLEALCDMEYPPTDFISSAARVFDWRESVSGYRSHQINYIMDILRTSGRLPHGETRERPPARQQQRSSEPERTENSGNTSRRPEKKSPFSYWWVALILFSLTRLIFNSGSPSSSGVSKELTVEDLKKFKPGTDVCEFVDCSRLSGSKGEDNKKYKGKPSPELEKAIKDLRKQREPLKELRESNPLFDPGASPEEITRRKAQPLFSNKKAEKTETNKKKKTKKKARKNKSEFDFEPLY